MSERAARDAGVVVISTVFSAAEVIGGLVLLVVALVGALAVRRRVLQRRWPTFEASVRTTPKPMGRGWTLGLGCYDENALRWYRLLSVRMRPGLVVDRRTLRITGSRCPIGHEARALLAGHVVLEVCDGDRLVELGVGDAARTHLTAWIETASRSGEQSLDVIAGRRVAAERVRSGPATGTDVSDGWPPASTGRRARPRMR